MHRGGRRLPLRRRSQKQRLLQRLQLGRVDLRLPSSDSSSSARRTLRVVAELSPPSSWVRCPRLPRRLSLRLDRDAQGDPRTRTTTTLSTTSMRERRLFGRGPATACQPLCMRRGSRGLCFSCAEAGLRFWTAKSMQHQGWLKFGRRRGLVFTSALELGTSTQLLHEIKHVALESYSRNICS